MRTLLLTMFCALLLVGCGSAPQAQKGPPKDKKSYTLHGKVTALNPAAKTVTVDHEKVEGWMEAMEMAYNVDQESVLQKLKVGDKIKATVYDDDFKLYNVEVVP
jgi:Cu/Ag efflux protein CusF